MQAAPPVNSDKILALRNVGPISDASFSIPDSGLLVFRGPQGVGKSTALKAIDSLVNESKPEFSVKDRELQANVDGFGVQLRLGRKCTRKGELTVTSIKGVSVDDLVDPGIDNPEAADAARIRALVRMTGTPADAALFHILVGGKDNFETLLPGIEIGEEDLLKLSGKIKRGLESKAREAEAAAEVERGKMLGAKESADGVDLKAESDAGKLQSSLEIVLARKTELETQATSATKAQDTAANARKSLDKAVAESAGLPSIADAKSTEAAALERHEACKSTVTRLRAELQAGENESTVAKTEWDAAVGARSSAESRASMVAGWEASIEAAARVVAPSGDDLIASAVAVSNARTAVETGTLIRKAQEQIAKAKQHGDKAIGHSEVAVELRQAAQGIDGVLSELVSRLGGRLRVEADRLITDTVRGKTFFADLSDGERYEIGIDMLVRRLGETAHGKGLGTIGQRAFGEIQPKIKKRIADYARQQGVLLVTAEVTDDERITAEVL